MDQTKIVTLENGYHLFTRKVNEGPVKLLCVHGGPGDNHEDFENFKMGLAGKGVKSILMTNGVILVRPARFF